MTAPTIVASFNFIGRTGTLPAGIQVNDLLIIYAVAFETEISSWVPPTGWTTDLATYQGNIGFPTGDGLRTGAVSYPGVIAHKRADGTESGTTITETIQNTGFIAIATDGLVIRGSGPLAPTVVLDTNTADFPAVSGYTTYPWFDRSTGNENTTNVPAVPAAANTLQLIAANADSNLGHGTTPPTLTNGWTVADFVQAPTSMWASGGPNVATVVTIPGAGAGGTPPDVYCIVVNVAAAPGGWYIGGIRVH